jgi:hypothetical protein
MLYPFCKVERHIIGELTQVLQRIHMCMSFARNIKDFLLRDKTSFVIATLELLGKTMMTEHILICF